MSATNSINVSVNRKARISLSAAGGKDMELSGATKNHRKLKNLGFEESGHTGFQKELTKEQLKAMINVQPDWNQNDEAAEDFIKNRTHYEYTKAEEISIEWQSDMPVDNLGEIKWVSYPGFSTTVPLVYGEVLTNIETGQDVVVEVNEEGSAVIGTDYYLFEDYGNGTYGYTSGYLYEASEQTGTYARYSREIKIIVPLDKKYLPPDFVGEVEINKEFISQNVDRIIALEDKDAELKKEIEACGKFERIELKDSSGNPLPNPYTLTEDVTQISHALNGQYKELYWIFNIPPNNTDGSSTEKARLYFYKDKATNTHESRLIIQGASYIQNYKSKWCAVLHSQVIGNYAKTDFWYTSATQVEQGYGLSPSEVAQSGIVAPMKDLGKDYIDYLTVKMTSENSGRVFPDGTTYEIWGVRK